MAGKPGVGKSGLAREVATWAAANGWTVRRVAATATGRAIPLGAFARWTDDVDGSPAAMARRVCEALTDGVEPDQNNPLGNDPGFPINRAIQKAWYLHIARLAHARGLSVGQKNGIETTDAEIGLLLPQSDPAHLLLCFNSACARGLAAALDRRAVPDHFVDLRESQWVEDCVRDQSRLQLLSDHLRDPQLSLRRALETFNETFNHAAGHSLHKGPAHARHP